MFVFVLKSAPYITTSGLIIDISNYYPPFRNYDAKLKN